MNIKNIVILTQYFPPETGAPQNRLFSLAKFLKVKGVNVSVITSLPSYPKSKIFSSYKNKFILKENISGINVYRSWLFVSKSPKIIFRLINYFSFVITSFLLGLRVVKNNTELIICESPPLFLGISALILKKIKRTKLLFNVSDLWPRTAEELGLIKNRFLLSMTKALEEYIYAKSDFLHPMERGDNTYSHNELVI